MSTPSTIRKVDVSHIDWHGPYIDIEDGLRYAYEDHYGSDVDGDFDGPATRFAEKYASKYAEALHPHLEGLV